MKKTDFIALILFAAIVALFVCWTPAMDAFKASTKAHPYGMAFIKFGLLATFGEMLGLRLKQGVYNKKGYGLLPRSIVWGILGVAIAIAMKVFSTGTPVMLETMGLNGAAEAMKGDITLVKVIDAFFISVMMNSFFGPVFMTFHKISDTHILEHEGRFSSLLCPIPIGRILGELNWKVQWGFVFKRTIPLFWIPAHTITFLLPPTFQVLFAASLSIVLGVLLSIAALLSREK